ncbi:putative bifunctional diguanylate cyclase/phosphodiesterase [Vibrio sp. VB16]|uniref:putative bifunctional diguanylate cyclase/phosphodiesterase n=1 Tax=Vibrio sp. VB16 TaxID=2785746 RepID=UPI00189D397C|nr:EAL domain-containing protein [Vibrio sp. VB16]UGA53655.1 EAL domain-containing protein [Vibrio sp. VB16]
MNTRIQYTRDERRHIINNESLNCMNKMTRLKNIWTIFFIIFITSFVIFSGVTYYNWTSSKQIVLNKQRTHVELFGNSVKAFFESQESLLDILGVHLITQHQLPKQPIHDSVLDNTMLSYPAFLGLGLVAYDGRPLVTSSNFDLSKVPNLMQLEQTRDSFIDARESHKINTGPTYMIKALGSHTFAMPIRKAIYLPRDASPAIAVMTAGIKLDNTPIFGGHTDLKPYHQVEIVRRDKYLQFSTDNEHVNYTIPVSDRYYSSLKQHTDNEQYFSIFDYDQLESGKTFQVVAHYDPYLEFWFVSKMDKQYIVSIFTNRFLASLAIFFLYNIVLFLLIRSISRSEKKNKKELLQQAHHDALTGLPNRILLFNRLRQTIATCNRSNHNHALLFLDIDDFKTINDTHGHEYGDRLLKEAASRIRQCLRVDDTLARFGGDEFVILLPQLDASIVAAKAQAEHIVNDLLETLARSYSLQQHQYSSSVSIGIVLFDDDSHSKSELIKQADIAMYQAKHSGKNTACFFDPEMQKKVAAQFNLENDLRIAIIEQQFELFYQPQVNQSNQTVGAEALIRWIHPEKGVVGPNQFIPIAEKTGLIIAIGEWVLKTACEQLNHWQQRKETQHLTLSVNVSYKQFRQPDFVAMVRKLLSEHNLINGKLRLELTESMLVDDMKRTISHMNELRELGVDFSLDDFGTGYSSLKYLKNLPLSQLKIDQSFVKDVESDASDQSIVKTIISMSEALGLNAIAEGVETLEQRTTLEREGCLVYQGYLYSKPIPIDEFEMYLKIKKENKDNKGAHV